MITKARTLFLLGCAIAFSIDGGGVVGFTAPSRATTSIATTTIGSSFGSKSIGLRQPLSSQVAETATTASAVETTGSTQDEVTNPPLFEKLGVGIKRDFDMRFPLFKSDITDGLNVQCLAATMFLFFACLAPAVGFGGLFAVATNGAIGTIEMVSSTAVCGIIYALFAAQPLTIIGSTGPVLAFVATLAQLAKKMDLPFLPLYSWTGLWTSAILFLSSVTSASNSVKYLTRFTDEIFSVLISTIFVVEAVSDVGRTFRSPASTFTKALLTLTLATVTYTTSTILKGLRNTSFFTKRIRTTISNFAPTIGVVTASLIARWARLVHGTSMAGLPSLSLPEVFGTTSGRPWLVPLGGLPVWARFGAIIPALMATVLLFLDQNITVRLVNNPQYSMKKGRRSSNAVLDGMHLDLLVIALLTAGQSLIGFPWLVAATVRSISHVRALAKYDNKNEFVGSIEQRVTGTAIHTLIGCCVLFAKPRKLLTQVPLPVLMGLFLYLGTSALPGNEMWERVVGLFQNWKKDAVAVVAPEKPWTGKVPTKIVHFFTLIQVACLGAMFWVKSSPIGVLFPIVIAMLAPLKIALEKTGIVKKEYMEVLDAE